VAEITAVNEKAPGRAGITFRVEAWEGQIQIGSGTHLRIIIDEARFMERVSGGK
jgi:predicted thioesterase